MNRLGMFISYQISVYLAGKHARIFAQLDVTTIEFQLVFDASHHFMIFC